jgi:acylphosphatase
MKALKFLEVSAIVKGHVQGVGFRATAKMLADRLKLTGFVRNLPEGHVEICAQGGKSQLEKFLSELKQEFPSHYIEEIVCDFHLATKSYSDFRMIR